MGRVEKYEMAQRLRFEAEAIRRHGLTNFFEHTFACLRYGPIMKAKEEDRCRLCPMREFIRSDYQHVSLPCQHINEQGWNLAAEHRELADQYMGWLLRTADQLEAEANREGR